MLAAAIKTDHKDYLAVLALARYAGLRLEECFRIDTNDARNALDSGELFVKGKGITLKDVQIWLGYSNFATTANIYAHLDATSKMISMNVMTGLVTA